VLGDGANCHAIAFFAYGEYTFLRIYDELNEYGLINCFCVQNSVTRTVDHTGFALEEGVNVPKDGLGRFAINDCVTKGKNTTRWLIGCVWLDL